MIYYLLYISKLMILVIILFGSLEFFLNMYTIGSFKNIFHFFWNYLFSMLFDNFNIFINTS